MGKYYLNIITFILVSVFCSAYENNEIYFANLTD